MGFFNFVFRYSSLNLFVLATILSFHIIYSKQQDQARLQSPPSFVVMQTPEFPLTSPIPPQVNTLPPPQATGGITIPPPISPPPPSPPPPQSNSRVSPRGNHQPRQLRPPSPPPPQPPRVFKQSEKSGLNTGKTMGLVFAGFAAMLQICVVALLVFKRKQLLRMTHTY